MTPEQKREFFKPTFTLKGRIFYPNLLTAKAKKEGGREIFDVMFGFDPKDPANAASIAAMGDFMGKAKNQFHPTVPVQFWVNPIKKYETYVRQDGKPNPEFLKGLSWFNASTGKDFPPVVVDQHRQPIMNPAEVYSGRNAVINVSFWAIDNEKKGLSMNVHAVMLLDGGDKVATGGAPAVNVNQIFGSFAADTVPAGNNTSTAQDPFGATSSNNGGTFGGFV